MAHTINLDHHRHRHFLPLPTAPPDHSFWKDDVNSYTRPWFAWANSLFGEVILHVADAFPQLIF